MAFFVIFCEVVSLLGNIQRDLGIRIFEKSKDYMLLFTDMNLILK